jgi:hypothetical protein
MQLSPQIAAEPDARLERLIRAGEAFYAARSPYHSYDGTDEAEEDRLCMACSKARLAFAEACEGFFLAEPACTA